MRYSIKTLLALTAVVALAIWVVMWLSSPTIYTAKLLNANSLRTNAPTSIVSSACWDVYEELRLRHFMDSKGQVTFSDGSSTDTTFHEMASKTGEVTNGKTYFDDMEGNQISLKWVTEPGIGTLLTWEYQGKDPQDISVVVQKSLASNGVITE